MFNSNQLTTEKHNKVTSPTHCGSSLRMVLTPVGPFCPFRSTAAIEMGSRLGKFTSKAPDFANEMQLIQLELQTSQKPDADRLRRVANELEKSVDQWESFNARLKLSEDFQTKEYAKLTEAHLASHGVSVPLLASMMRWQSGCLRSMANNTPPPMPPPGVDLQRMMAQDNSREKPSISAMQSAEIITADPFDPKDFKSPGIKQEYEKLCRDHVAIIEYGGKYATFDPLGKIAFLDEIEKIEERWDVFFLRFKLMGAINNDFKKQCDQFLASMSMTEEEYRELLKKTHTSMRADAEKERDLMAQS